MAASPELQVSRVNVAKRKVIPRNTLGYIRGNLETNIDGTYIVQPSNKKALVSRLFGHGSSVCMKVINESYKFITFKKGSLIGHAESADLFLTTKLLIQVYIYHKIPKAFSKFYYRHSELIVKYNIGLKTLLQQGISEPIFYGDLFYTFKRIVGKPNFVINSKRL